LMMDKGKYFILIGGSMGSFHVYYNENVMMKEIFHHGDLKKIKIKNKVLNEIGSPREEIILFYGRVIVEIQVISFFLCIKYVMNGNDGTPPFLSYKKWIIEKQQKSIDLCPFNGGILSSLTRTYNHDKFYISVGYLPYIACFSAKEDLNPFKTVAALATNVASKLTNAVFSFIGSFINENDMNKERSQRILREKAVKLVLTHSMDNRNNLDGIEYNKIEVDSNSSLAFIIDNKNNIMILDIVDFCFIRRFEDYNDVDCSWIQLYNDDFNHFKTQLCLVILRKDVNILELWKMKYGDKIFNIDLNEDFQWFLGDGGGVLGFDWDKDGSFKNDVEFKRFYINHGYNIISNCFLICNDGYISIINENLNINLPSKYLKPREVKEKEKEKGKEESIYSQIMILLKNNKNIWNNPNVSFSSEFIALTLLLEQLNIEEEIYNIYIYLSEIELITFNVLLLLYDHHHEKFKENKFIIYRKQLLLLYSKYQSFYDRNSNFNFNLLIFDMKDFKDFIIKGNRNNDSFNIFAYNKKSFDVINYINFKKLEYYEFLNFYSNNKKNKYLNDEILKKINSFILNGLFLGNKSFPLINDTINLIYSNSSNIKIFTNLLLPW